MNTVDRERVCTFLRSCEAERLVHPGGSLYEHLCRVSMLLSDWGADETMQMAGLCHACYGTDGFDHAMVDVTDRRTLVELIGPTAEELVYLYCSCDRAAVYQLLADDGPVAFRDRFTGRVHTHHGERWVPSWRSQQRMSSTPSPTITPCSQNTARSCSCCSRARVAAYRRQHGVLAWIYSEP